MLNQVKPHRSSGEFENFSFFKASFVLDSKEKRGYKTLLLHDLELF